MRIVLSSCLLFASALNAFADLSVDQKTLDFQVLAGLYAKNYALNEWKRDVVHFDLFNLKPWLDRGQKSKGDLEFYEICAEYVASLNDVHSGFIVPSTFRADLGIRTDIYEGKALIDEIDRTVVPSGDFPFEIGDELVAVDGVKADVFRAKFARLQAFGNSRSTSRYAASFLAVREQSTYPRAP